MTQPPSGGAGTHYGLLYQILSSLHRALTISKSKRKNNIVLTVESTGGDLTETRLRRRDVYQFKARSRRDAWSLNAIIDDVLPDLYRAARDESRIPTTYWLVTEGHRGSWDAAWELFRRLQDMNDPAFVESLDATTHRRFFPNRSLSERELFREIVRRVSGEPSPSAEADERVRLILANFEIRSQPIADVRVEVHRALLGFDVQREKVQAKAREMFGILLDWGAEGNRSFDVDDLLAAAGLASTSLGLLPLATEQIREQLNLRIEKAGYDTETHVRRAVSWPADANVLCLSGDSGMGKTSLLAQIADEAAKDGPVVFVRPSSSSEDSLQLAANELWLNVLGNEGPLTLKSLARRAEKLQLRAPWLTVCLDITADDKLALQLLDEPWSRWRVRVAFTADQGAEKKIAEAKRRDIALHLVEELTPRQIRQFLEKRNIDWRQIPSFLIEPLRRRPILAHVYAEIDDVQAWQDSNEYKLFGRFWQRLHLAPAQSSHFSDEALLLKLAASFIDDPSRFRWSAVVMYAEGIDDDTRIRLQRLGWLRNLEDGAAEFPHDRLLNWAVAKAMVERFNSHTWSSAELGQVLAEITSVDNRLGFLPMDVVYLLTTSNASAEEIANVIEAIEQHEHELYDSLLPSIGADVVPALLARLKRLPERQHGGLQSRIGACILSIDKRQSLGDSTVLRILNGDHSAVQRVGAQLLRLNPNAAALDRLWDLQLDRLAWPNDDETMMTRHLELESIDMALEACVRLDPDWIARALLRSESASDIAALLWDLTKVADTRGQELWLTTRDRVLLFESKEVMKAAARCIGRFRDTEAIPSLITWIAHASAEVASEAFSALVFTDPNRALEVLGETTRLDDFAYGASGWLSFLVAFDRARLSSIIAERMRRGDFTRSSWYFWVLSRDVRVITDLADAAIARLHGLLPTPEHTKELDHLVSLISNVADARRLSLLGEYAGTPFGLLLGGYAAERVATSDHEPDQFLKAAHRLLLKIGGRPLEEFLLAQLDRTDHGWMPAKISATQAAPSPVIRERVRNLLDDVWSDEKRWPVRQACVDTLVSMGDRGILLQSAEAGSVFLTDITTQAFVELPPTFDAEAASLLDRLDRGDDVPHVLHVLACTGREDAARNALQAATSSSDPEVIHEAIVALRYLPTKSMSIDEIKLLKPIDRALYYELLFRIGDSESDETVARSIMERAEWMDDDEAYFAAWLVCERGRRELAPLVWSWAKRSHFPFFRENATVWSALGFVDDEEAADLLMTEAFGSDRSAPRPSAIRGLAHRSPAAAYDAAKRLLTHSSPSRSAAPDLLLEIDADDGVLVLAQNLPQETNVLVRINSCIALRSHPRSAAQIVEQLLADSKPSQRAAGCQLSGWTTDFAAAVEVRSLGLGDIDPMVRSFALDALALHDTQRRIAELLAAFGKSSGTAAWALAETIIATGPSFLLSNADDPLGLTPSLHGHPFALRAHAYDLLNKAIKRTEEDYQKATFRDFYRC